MSEKLNKTTGQPVGFDRILDLSRRISEQMGRGGVLDSPEVAINKLILGDPSKKAGDRAEIDEIGEELQRDKIDPVDLAGEIADFVYYRSKIPDFPLDLEEEFILSCGFSVDSARRAAEVKYTARVEANINGLSKDQRKAFERQKLEEMTSSGSNVFDLGRLDSSAALRSIAKIKSHFLPNGSMNS